VRPSWHTPLASQHPSGHVVALQDGMKAQYDPGSLHFLPSPAQFSQEAPAFPQSALAVPGRQTPEASQQPPQVVESHGGNGLKHRPPTSHPRPMAEHTVHALPFTPQASVSSPARQRPRESQQPLHEAWHAGAVP
jgi:hypothetical protein